jgi:hypothetical protein
MAEKDQSAQKAAHNRHFLGINLKADNIYYVDVQSIAALRESFLLTGTGIAQSAPNEHPSICIA